MSNTVLGFWDFFWIWWVMAIAGGGTTFLKNGSQNKQAFEALEKRIAALQEEIRALKRDGGRTG
ncbi:MAG: bZIP transcription factor [Hyphomicrobiaceae bacterium]